jgi:hypothetical protein
MSNGSTANTDTNKLDESKIKDSNCLRPEKKWDFIGKPEVVLGSGTDNTAVKVPICTSRLHCTRIDLNF